MKHNGQFYENGLPYLPLYESTVEGFQQNTNFVANPNLFMDKHIWQKPYVIVVNLKDTDYGEIIEKYGPIKITKYVIAPDASEFWIVTDHYYIRAAGISGKIKEGLPEGKVQCVLASKSQPICLPFILMQRKQIG